MVGINIKISLALYLQIEQAVPGEQFEHVVEKTYACRNIRYSLAVQFQVH
jgi:hypothetical protein